MFKISSKGFMLTYPRCEMTKEDALAHAKINWPAYDKILVCKELHEDGAPHLHIYVKFSRQISTRNCRYFDLNQWHGKYEAAKSTKWAVNYVKKDGDYIEEGMDYK